MNEFIGKVVKVLYRNEDFLIAKLQTDNEELTIKGSIYGVNKGEEVKVRGTWENHTQFGKQFVVEFWERPIPQTKDQVIAFLASPLIKGCGPKQSVVIAEKLGKTL